MDEPTTTPSSDGTGAAAPETGPGAPRDVPPGGRMLAAGRGVTWWGDGWRLFVASPWIFIAIVVLFVLLLAGLSVVPIVGSIASTLLGPVFAGGVFLGCRALDRGGELTIAHLFAGFSERAGPLVVVGLLYLAGTFALVFVFVALFLGMVGMSGVHLLLSGDPIQLGIATLATFGLGAALAGLVTLLLGVPLLMACWFAPALVALRHDEPFAAMKASFFACLGNVLPFLVYGLLGLVFSILASIPLGLGWLVLGPLSITSIYASYKDLFGD